MKYKSDANVCRENGWGVGTVVSGVCPYGRPVEIRITAIGESNILARRKGSVEGHNWDLAQWSDVRVVKAGVGPEWRATLRRMARQSRQTAKFVHENPGGGD